MADRDKILQTRVSTPVLDAIDRQRNAWSRSEYVRQAVKAAIKAGLVGPEQVDL